MASVPNPKTVTYEEWLRMPEVQDAVEEVVNGEIRIMPPPKLKHMQVIAKVYDAIRSQIDQQSTLVYPAGVGVIVTEVPLTSRVPDLTMFDAATMVERDGYIHSAPQLVVEVLSPANTRREREEKIGDYASIGVPEVWVVSPEARTVEILYLAEGFLRSVQILREGVLTPRHFPGVQVEIAPDLARVTSDDIHPIHLDRHSFELTNVAGQATSGVVKDVVMVGRYQETAIDFVADNPSLTLFHCHQQLHMDFGFTALFEYV